MDVQCTRCNQLHTPGAKFCKNCGAPIPQQSQTPQGYTAHAPQPVYQPVPPGPQSAYQPAAIHSQQPYQAGSAVPHQPYQPTAPAQYPQYQAPYQPWQQPAALQLTLWGRPVHFWLLVAAAVALVALLLPWYSATTSSQVNWQTRGFEYSDGSRSTWSVPVGSTTMTAGGNGLNVLTLALVAAMGGLGLAYRGGVWPRWAGYTLAASVALTVFVGGINLAYDANIGPVLFAVAGGIAALPTLKVLSARSR